MMKHSYTEPNPGAMGNREAREKIQRILAAPISADFKLVAIDVLLRCPPGEGVAYTCTDAILATGKAARTCDVVIRRMVASGLLIETGPLQYRVECDRLAAPMPPAKNAPGTTLSYDQTFEDFWAEYPARRGRKAGKRLAFGEFQKALRITDLKTIMRGVRNYSATEEVQRGYAVDAGRWLHGERWEDEIGGPNSPGGGNGAPRPAKLTDRRPNEPMDVWQNRLQFGGRE